MVEYSAAPDGFQDLAPDTASAGRIETEEAASLNDPCQIIRLVWPLVEKGV